MSSAKYPKTDTSNMSMVEILKLRERKKKLTEAYLAEEIKADPSSNLGIVCCCCGAHPHRVLPMMLSDGTFFPGSIVPLPVIEIDGDLLCEDCFVAYWCVIREDKLKLRAGSTRVSMPRSEREYDGGRFHSGEW